MRTVLVTGGLGFIGSCFVKRMLEQTRSTRIVNVDKMTYAAANGTRFHGWPEEPGPSKSYVPQLYELGDRHIVAKCSVEHAGGMGNIFDRFKPDAVVHFAAESHVDRAIDGGGQFVDSNVKGTQVLLDCCQTHGIGKFVYVSTDEVYGPVAAPGCSKESDRLDPRNPYSATKAAAEYLCMSHFNTYATPVVISRGCNTYGPWQYPEKLLPLMILNALEGKPLPVYGDGMQSREWIDVREHCDAISFLLENGELGNIYNIGTGDCWTNLRLVRRIVTMVKADPAQIKHVEDRPGHDNRYALNSYKIHRQGCNVRQPHLGNGGLERLIAWHRSEEGQVWCARVRSDARDRLGLPHTEKRE